MTLIVRGLNKAYGTQSVLHDIDLSLTVSNGITALLGANGSGKSTLLRVLATSIRPDSGWLSFDNQSYRGDLRSLRQIIGYLPQSIDLPDSMTMFKVLHYLARLKGIHEPSSIYHLLDMLGLTDLASKPLRQLSAGQIRLVGIAQALVGQPQLLFLDEVLRGLDAHERERVMRVLRLRAAEAVILFSSHLPAEVEQIARRVLVLEHGSVLFEGDISALTTYAAGCVYELHTTRFDMPKLTSLYTVSRIQQNGDKAVLRVISTKVVPDGVLVPAMLEDAYLLLCKGGDHANY